MWPWSTSARWELAGNTRSPNYICGQTRQKPSFSLRYLDSSFHHTCHWNRKASASTALTRLGPLVTVKSTVLNATGGDNSINVTKSRFNANTLRKRLKKRSVLIRYSDSPKWVTCINWSINARTKPLPESRNRRYWNLNQNRLTSTLFDHDDVIEWKDFPCYWPFVRGIHRLPGNSQHIDRWSGALMFSLICARINA